MKRLFVFILFCTLGAVVYAQQSLLDGYEGPNYPTAADQAFERMLAKVFKKADAETALSTLKVGRYVFKLAGEQNAQDRGREVQYRFYRPENGPAVFEEAVGQDIATGEFTLVRSHVQSLVGPMSWKYVTYTIPEIKISVYTGNELPYVRGKWDGQFGDSCTHQYRMQKTWPMDIVDVWTAPARAFYLNGYTVAIEPVVVSEELDNYPRACKVHAAGVLYKKFMAGAEKFMIRWQQYH